MCHSLPFVFTPFFIPSVTLSLVTWLICVPHLIYPAMPKSILTTSLHVNNVGLPFSLKFSWVNEWIFEGWELRSSAGCDAWMPLLACYAHCLRFHNTMSTSYYYCLVHYSKELYRCASKTWVMGCVCTWQTP